MFGEEALVVNLATSATAIAEGPVSCVGMDRATFTEVRTGLLSRLSLTERGGVERGKRNSDKHAFCLVKRWPASSPHGVPVRQRCTFILTLMRWDGHVETPLTAIASRFCVKRKSHACFADGTASHGASPLKG